MKPKLVVLIATFLSLVLLPLGLRQTRLTEHVAKLEPSPEKNQEELLYILDLISDLDSSLAKIRQKPDEEWTRNLFKPVTKRRRMTKKRTEKQKTGSWPRLTSVIVNGDDCYAILDNQIVRIGDVVKNVKIVKIEMGKVTLSYGDQTIVLTLD